MPDIDFRQIALDAVVKCLSLGLNNALAANAERYGVEAFELDFSDTSTNFARSYVDPENIEVSSLMEFPAACVYTDDAEDAGQPYALAFSGGIIVCADFYIRQREGAEGVDTESAINRIDAAVFGLFRSYIWPIAANTSTLTYSRRTKSQRRHFIPLGDGWASRISIQAQFGISIN